MEILISLGFAVGLLLIAAGITLLWCYFMDRHPVAFGIVGSIGAVVAFTLCIYYSLFE